MINMYLKNSAKITKYHELGYTNLQLLQYNNRLSTSTLPPSWKTLQYPHLPATFSVSPYLWSFC